MGFYQKDSHRYFLSVRTGRDTQLNQAAMLVREYQRDPDNTVIVGVEKIMTQVAVYQLILDWQAGRIELPGVDNNKRNIPILAVEPGGKDKVARLQMHQASFERGEVHLHFTMRELAERLSAFPALEHDDDIDSMIYCLEKSYNRFFDGGGESKYNSESRQTIVGNIMNKQF